MTGPAVERPDLIAEVFEDEPPNESATRVTLGAPIAPAGERLEPVEPGDERTYLGDGVYAEFHGFQIVLSTERYGRIETIYLEPSVYASLVEYAAQCGFGGARSDG